MNNTEYEALGTHRSDDRQPVSDVVAIGERKLPKRKASEKTTRKCDDGVGCACKCRQSYDNWINSVK